MRQLLVCVVSLSLVGCATLSGKKTQDWSVEGERYVVAADHPAASQAGLEMLKKGGNVVDAAAAVSLALAVVRPQSTGLGGGGFMLLNLVGKPPLVLDYRETAPAAATPENYLDEAGEKIPGKTVYGHWAAGVPGLLAGVNHALKNYGTMSLTEVLQPAIALAADGFKVDAHLHNAMGHLAEYVRQRQQAGTAGAFNEAARVFLLPSGKPYPIGARLKQPALAKSLRMMQHDGIEAFYSKTIARRILQSMQDYDGPLQRGDLEEYKVKVREPLVGTYRGYKVIGMPPPSSGGAAVVQILGVMESVQPQAPASEYTHVLAEAMKHAFADRATYLGDPDAFPEVGADVARMISPEHIAKVRAAIQPGKVADASHYGMRYLRDDHGTSHFSIIDAEGNAVAATETVNTYFGSMIVPIETGIVLNNQMDDFTVKPGARNYFGLEESARNVIRPGARPLSSMSPTLLLKDGRAVLAVGASGGPRIITATVQTLLNAVDRGLNAEQAVSAKRVHHQWSPNELLMEEGFSVEVRRALEAAGHTVKPLGGHLGMAQMVLRRGGRIYGVSDPRKGGRPAGK
jgi:gamma-glutamyltranspeptidase/glutathione hydrolase